MLATPELWVLVSFVLFLGLLVYYKIPNTLAKALDDRADRIRAELDEARRLREEAQQILADYQRKQRDAEKEAEDIIAVARREAEFFAEESRKALGESLQRRLKLAEEKIARAEDQAVQDIRSKAVDAAVAAAELLIARELKDKSAKSLVDKSIRDVSAKLN
jgi:F-type H+-transporting ATPase subunit b